MSHQTSSHHLSRTSTTPIHLSLSHLPSLLRRLRVLHTMVWRHVVGWASGSRVAFGGGVMGRGGEGREEEQKRLSSPFYTSSGIRFPHLSRKAASPTQAALVTRARSRHHHIIEPKTCYNSTSSILFSVLHFCLFYTLSLFFSVVFSPPVVWLPGYGFLGLVSWARLVGSAELELTGVGLNSLS